MTTQALGRAWQCEHCPFETDSMENAKAHAVRSGHRTALAAFVVSHPRRPLARAETTGRGAMVTDGVDLFEVVAARTRKVAAGVRVMRVEERRLLDVMLPVPWDEERAAGRWQPFSELVGLEVVRPAPAG